MIRMIARQEVLAYQDDKALRTALDSRPRIYRLFTPGEKVAFWRKQRSKAFRQARARWHGLATIIGRHRQNYWISFGGQVMKCSPRQLRPASSDGKKGELVPDDLKNELARVKQQLPIGS